MKILVLGNGKHTNKRIIPSLKNLNEVTSIVVGDRNITEDRIIDETITISNYKKLIDSEDFFDLSIIATPPHNHLESFEGIRTKSKKVLIEKPFTTEVRHILSKKFEKYLDQKLLFEAIMYFHHPLWKEVKKIVATNKIIDIHSEFSVPHLAKNDYRYSRLKGGGSLGDQGIYPLSLISVLMKDKYTINNIFTSSAKGYDVDLLGEINVTLDNEINFTGKWGLGVKYKNSLKLVSNNGTSYEVDFFFSKPEITESRIIVTKENSKYEIVVGRYNQFELMYRDALNNNIKKFFYSTPKHLMMRYSIFNEVMENIRKSK